MTLNHTSPSLGHRDARQPHARRIPTLRLRLKPRRAARGFVDGAWWPRSPDLATEVPGLLAVLAIRLGRIDRVVYNINGWAKAPAWIRSGGHEVRLDGYPFQPVNTLYVVGANRKRMALLVVPPYTEPDYAHATMMTAAKPNSATTADDLLMVGVREASQLAAQNRWDSEGGAGKVRRP
ncbi:hypothetical protein ABIC28_004641 [Rhodococcus sp. PvR044]|nr:hypothetical protein C8K38_111156 [Rhodococcus sp. OK611]SNX91564.1 hypothetical protein SAMN05447004_110101 [Rhodococcus sp. OK270]